MFHDAEVNGHARHTIGCAVILAFAAVLMQCAHGQPGTGEQPPLLPQTLGAETRVFRNCPGCPEMVEIPGGTFPMGTNGWRDDTRPAHTVTVGPFAMGLRESHPGRVRRLCRSNRTDPAQLPVPQELMPYDNGAARCLTWHDAKAYADWLSHRTGRPSRATTINAALGFPTFSISASELVRRWRAPTGAGRPGRCAVRCPEIVYSSRRRCWWSARCGVSSATRAASTRSTASTCGGKRERVEHGGQGQEATVGVLCRLDEVRTDTASTSWCPLSAAPRARSRQPTQRSNRATQYHAFHCIRLNSSSQKTG